MPAFEYIAIDKNGMHKKGIGQGESPRQIRQTLREQGLTPLNVNEISQKETQKTASSWTVRRIPQAEVTLMTRQLATLVRAGLPLDDALQTLAEQVEHKQMLSMIQAIRAKVIEGHTLSEGMSQFPNAFSDLYLATVSAGEQSRDMALVLERLADYIEQRQELAQKVKLALLYPIILSIAALFVTGGLLVYIVPEIVQIFDNSKQELPLITRTLIWVSDLVQAWWLLGFILAALSTIFLKWYLAKEKPKFRFHQLLLKLPIVGSLILETNASRFTHTLGVLLASGVPMIEALKIATTAIHSLPIRESVRQTSIRVREGEALHQALKQSTQLPPMTIHLIANGEASGNLEDMLQNATVAHERNIKTKISIFLGLMEPVLILVMGLIVLFIVIAILLPIFELNQLI